MEENHSSRPPMGLAWTIWGLGALFYLAAFFQRVAPAVMTRELMQDFNVSASGLGHLSGLYFYAYVAMQIPTGILADTLGPRKLLSGGAVIAGLGTLFFAISPGFAGAGAGRLLIGGSVAVAFVGLLKLSSAWFPKSVHAFVTGNALSIGLVGAVFAGVPLRFAMDYFHWRQVIFITGLMTLVLGVMIWVVVRDRPREKGYADFTGQGSEPQPFSLVQIFRNIRAVFRYRNTWLLFCIPGGIVGPILTFSGLWGVPYLVSHHGMTHAKAASLTSVLLIAWAVGAPAFGWLSDRLKNRKTLYIAGSLLTALGWWVILFWTDLPFWSLVLALAGTGFFSGCMIVSFAFATESVPPDLSGTVSGLINMGVMMGPTLLQPAVGRILDRFWTGDLAQGVRIYSFESYGAGFMPVMAWALATVVLLFFTKETHCSQVEGL